MKFGIQQKLISGFVLIILFFSLSSMIGLYYLNLVVSDVEITFQNAMIVNHTTQEIQIITLSIQQKMNSITLDQDTIGLGHQIKEIKMEEEKALKLFSILQSQPLGNKGKLIAMRTCNIFCQWRSLRKKTVELTQQKKFGQARTLNRIEGDSYVRLLQRDIDDIKDCAENRVKFYKENTNVIANKTKIIGSVTIILNILLSLLISLYLAFSITRRLKLINIATSKMATGNINQKLEIKGRDELSQVARNFNNMANGLANMYSDLEDNVRKRTNELKTANEELQHIKTELEIKVIERTKDLEEKIIELNRSQLAMLYMIEDMNETSRQLRSTQEELIRKERLAILGQFSGNISHELRNPLGVISSSIYYLQMCLNEKDEKIHQHLCRISQSVRSATTIIENLLNLTRMNKPILTQYNLPSLLNECLSSCNIPEKIKVVKDFPSESILIKAEKEQIRMVIDNLVKNAIAAMNGIGTLTIMIRETLTKEVEISFIDTGYGIDPEHLNQVFLPLFSTKAKGIGLGLSIAKMIVDNHGGKISVEPAPEKGAKFIITLKSIHSQK